MNTEERKKVSVITKYAADSFTAEDWDTLGQITGKQNIIDAQPRLLRSLSFGDDDYESCAAEVLSTIFTQDNTLIPGVIDHFDIDLWHQQKYPEKHKRVFGTDAVSSADFWEENYLKVFVSHLSTNRKQVSAMKSHFANWGISAFIAHEDIEPTREWIIEIEAGLATMEVLIAVVEPKFKDSNWCCQEVGFALGKKIDIIPLRAGHDPFGFFGKFQGIQIKGKTPAQVATEVTHTLFKKPKYRSKILLSMSKALPTLQSSQKQTIIQTLDSWSIATDVQIKTLLEQIALSNSEREQLKNIIDRVNAFTPTKLIATSLISNDDIPF